MIPTLTNPMGITRPYKTKLQYLYNQDTNAWIDSGYVPSRNGFRIVFDGYMIPEGGDAYWYGFRQIRNGYGREGINLASSGAGLLTYCGGNYSFINRSYLSDPVQVSMTYTKTGDNSYTLTMEAGGETRIRTTLTEDDFVGPAVTIPLFRLRQYLYDTGEETHHVTFPVKIIQFRVYDASGNLVRNMIPVLDRSDVPCMYDTVLRAFFYNAGTGTFNYA